MGVDKNWLANVRKSNRAQLGLGGMGASVAEQIAANYEARRTGQYVSQAEAAQKAMEAAQAVAQGRQPDQGWPKWMVYSAAGVGVLLAGALGYGVYRAVRG